MSQFKTDRRYGNLVFLGILIVIPLLFLHVSFFIKLLIFLGYIAIFLVATTDINSSNDGMIIRKPFNPIYSDALFYWNDLLKVRVVYRGGITHGAMMPSYIEFTGKGKSRKVNYRLSKEELQTLDRSL